MPRGRSTALSLCALNSHICCVTCNHFFEQPLGLPVLDPPSQNLEQCLVINGIEEFANVATPEETIAVLCKKILRTFYGSQKPLSSTAGPYIIYERLIVDVDQVLVEQAMNEAILDTCDGNFSFLGIVYTEGVIGAVTVCLATKFLMQLTEICFQVIAEVFQFLRVLFPSHESLPTMP